jgi:pantoate--beta-alanine ligase
VDVIRDAVSARAATDGWRAEGSAIGFVPTMGALHRGHTSLFRAARDACDRVVASIFVNPRQFEDSADLERYPRDETRDLEVCEREKIDAVWAPPADEVYPPGVPVLEPDPGPVAQTFEGAARPGHFAGVLTVVHRLFTVIGPARAYFGEKDAQQLFLVRKMLAELGLPNEIIACPTVRERDGLALSSRNARLSAEEREQAGCLFLALSEAAELARGGERDARILVAAMAREIGATPLARLDYAAIVAEATFESLTVVDEPARAIVAARFPSARLIDNLLLPEPAA